jgi:hypothetical protein
MDTERNTLRRLCALPLMLLTAAAIAVAISALLVTVAPAAQAADCTEHNPAGAQYPDIIYRGGVVKPDDAALCVCPPGTEFQLTSDTHTVNCASTQPPPAQKPPVDQVRMRITTNLGRANVALTNQSDLAGTCAYDASDTKGLLPSVHRDVDIAPKGTATISDLLAPPLLSTYHVVLSCKGDFNGNQVEFGHVEQDVSSF